MEILNLLSTGTIIPCFGISSLYNHNLATTTLQKSFKAIILNFETLNY